MVTSRLGTYMWAYSGLVADLLYFHQLHEFIAIRAKAIDKMCLWRLDESIHRERNDLAALCIETLRVPIHMGILH